MAQQNGAIVPTQGHPVLRTTNLPNSQLLWNNLKLYQAKKGNIPNPTIWQVDIEVEPLLLSQEPLWRQLGSHDDYDQLPSPVA